METIASVVKVSDTEIAIEKVSAPVTTTNTYNVMFLLEQKLGVIKNSLAYTEQRKAEIAEVNTLLAKCSEFGVTVEPSLILQESEVALNDEEATRIQDLLNQIDSLLTQLEALL